LEENQQNKRLVNAVYDNIKNLSENTCQSEFELKLNDKTFDKLTELFDQYTSYLRYENGRLSRFWISYLDMVEILLGLLRSSREGDWDLHLARIRKMIPWCFVYDNHHYARYILINFCTFRHAKSYIKEVFIIVLYFFQVLIFIRI